MSIEDPVEIKQEEMSTTAEWKDWTGPMKVWLNFPCYRPDLLTIGEIPR